MSVNRTQLGGSGLEISRVVFGSMGQHEATEPERIAVIRAAIESGTTSIDTAPLYEFGEIECTVGKAVRECRDDVELLSKVGLRWDADHGDVLFEFTDKHGARRAVRRDSRPCAIRKDVEESLARLQTDRIDLCQIHHPDPSVPIADSLGELGRLVDEGKIGHIGVSNFSGREFEDAISALTSSSSVKIAGHQLNYSLIKQGSVKEIISLSQEHGIGVLAYSPLASGALTGKLFALEGGGATVSHASFRPANAKRINKAVRECIEPVAKRLDASIAQVSLAWLLHQQDVTAVVAGGSSPEQAIANSAADEILLSREDLGLIGQRFAQIRIDPGAGLGWNAAAGKIVMRAKRKLLKWIRPT